MAERKNTEEGKAASSLYALNPISRRYVLKTSDVYLRLLKSGVVSDELAMEALDLRKREASRARQRGAAKAAAAATEPRATLSAEPAPETRPREPETRSKNDPRAEVRRRVIKTALDHQSELDGCQDDHELEERLRRLLVPTGRNNASQRARQATHARHFVNSASDDETSDTEY